MRNYAGHRLAPWLAHVMVSRQETARQLLTPGEVMQLPPDEELVLVAGLAPIRARKLRYYTDRNFTDRRLAAPGLNERAYPDRPAERPHDWASQTRSVDARLAMPTEEGSEDEDGGLQQQRHPGLPEHQKPSRKGENTAPQTDIAENDDVAADKRAMDQARGLAPAVRAHALNESSRHDLVPGL